MTVKFIKLSDRAHQPTRGSDYAAGYDLYAAYETIIPPGECKLIYTDIAIELPQFSFGAIYARSGLATKRGLRPANCVGVIDEDYRGNIAVALMNDSKIEQKINAGDRIAQMVVQPYCIVDFKEVNELNKSVRGEDGFGSTGIK